jgi:hypothetical protein
MQVNINRPAEVVDSIEMIYRKAVETLSGAFLLNTKLFIIFTIISSISPHFNSSQKIFGIY